MGKNLIILGNGFDLYCGLHSKFSDFFKYSQSNNPKYRIFIDNVLKDTSQYAILNPVSAFTEQKLPRFSYDFSFVDALFILLFSNRKVDYWNDVEAALQKAIMGNSSISLSKISNYVSTNDIYRRSISVSKLSKDEKLLAIMINKKIDSADFYNAYLLEQLNYFEQRFADYIYNQISIDSQKVAYQKEALNALCRIFDTEKGQCPPDKNDSGSIIYSFNYIDISELGLNQFDVDFIHGSIKNNDLIIGISDERNNPLYDKLTKSKRRYHITHNKISCKDVTDVKIFGHSFNKQDYYYYFVLFERIDLINRYNDITFHIIYAEHDAISADEIKKHLIDNFEDMMKKYFNDVVKLPQLFDIIADNIQLHDITK